MVGSADLGWEILGNFGKLITRKVSLKEVGGPITIVRAGSRAAKAGLTQFLFLTALISMNLAVLNALPIPFLDGGHAAILIIERLRGRDLSVLVKERILQGGFLFLASLMAMVIALDILKVRRKFLVLACFPARLLPSHGPSPASAPAPSRASRLSPMVLPSARAMRTLILPRGSR